MKQKLKYLLIIGTTLNIANGGMGEAFEGSCFNNVENIPTGHHTMPSTSIPTPRSFDYDTIATELQRTIDELATHTKDLAAGLSDTPTATATKRQALITLLHDLSTMGFVDTEKTTANLEKYARNSLAQLNANDQRSKTYTLIVKGLEETIELLSNRVEALTYLSKEIYRIEAGASTSLQKVIDDALDAVYTEHKAALNLMFQLKTGALSAEEKKYLKEKFTSVKNPPQNTFAYENVITGLEQHILRLNNRITSLSNLSEDLYFAAGRKPSRRQETINTTLDTANTERKETLDLMFKLTSGTLNATEWGMLEQKFGTPWAPAVKNYTVQYTAPFLSPHLPRSDKSLLKKAKINCLGKVERITYTPYTKPQSKAVTTPSTTPPMFSSKLPLIVREVLEAGLEN